MKAQYRQTLLSKRDNMPSKEVTEAGKAMKKRFLESDLSVIPPGSSIMLYSSFRNEADTWGLIRYYHSSGVKVVLPVTVGDDIIPYEYSGDDALIKDPFGILVPDRDKCARADISSIHVVIVPGIGFDRSGNRLGFGKGYYDRFLPLVPDALKIGLCYDFQILPGIPSGELDVPVDLLLTETALINCKR